MSKKDLTPHAVSMIQSGLLFLETLANAMEFPEVTIEIGLMRNWWKNDYRYSTKIEPEILPEHQELLDEFAQKITRKNVIQFGNELPGFSALFKEANETIDKMKPTKYWINKVSNGWLLEADSPRGYFEGESTYYPDLKTLLDSLKTE